MDLYCIKEPKKPNLLMPLLEPQLIVKRSKIPGAGKGLFTRVFIPKGTRIVRYKGYTTTWKSVQNQPHFNGYVYYVKRDFVIDAKNYTSTFARYANDATGLTRVKNLINNCRYVMEGNKVYVESIRDIKAGDEILVPYGKDYWDVIRYNKRNGFM